MEIEQLIPEIQRIGWGNIKQNKYFGYSMVDAPKFDLVAERKFTLTKWFLLIKKIKVFDRNAYNEYQIVFNIISKNVKSWIWGKCFLLCIICDEISSELKRDMESDSFGLFGVLRMQGGGGLALIVDAKTKRCYGKIPALPYDVHKYSGEFKEMIEDFLVNITTKEKNRSNIKKGYCNDCGKKISKNAQFCSSCGAKQ